MRRSAVQCSTVQYSAEQCSAEQCILLEKCSARTHVKGSFDITSYLSHINPKHFFPFLLSSPLLPFSSFLHLLMVPILQAATLHLTIHLFSSASLYFYFPLLLILSHFVSSPLFSSPSHYLLDSALILLTYLLYFYSLYP